MGLGRLVVKAASKAAAKPAARLAVGAARSVVETAIDGGPRVESRLPYRFVFYAKGGARSGVNRTVSIHDEDDMEICVFHRGGLFSRFRKGAPDLVRELSGRQGVILDATGSSVALVESTGWGEKTEYSLAVWGADALTMSLAVPESHSVSERGVLIIDRMTLFPSGWEIELDFVENILAGSQMAYFDAPKSKVWRAYEGAHLVAKVSASENSGPAFDELLVVEYARSQDMIPALFLGIAYSGMFERR